MSRASGPSIPPSFETGAFSRRTLSARALSAPRRAARPRRRHALACALGLALAGASMAQQTIRPIPPQAVPGIIELKVFPEAVIDGAPVRLGAGARLRDLDNRIVMPGTVPGSRKVLYTKDGGGFVDRIWLATEAEYDAAKKARP